MGRSAWVENSGSSGGGCFTLCWLDFACDRVHIRGMKCCTPSFVTDVSMEYTHESDSAISVTPRHTAGHVDGCQTLGFKVYIGKRC